MKKMWTGCTDGVTDIKADELNSSIKFDKRFYKNDIEGSIAHAKMLAFKNIISKNDAEEIIKGLEGILADIDSGALLIDDKAEDIHMFVEEVLTSRIGDVGKKLHTARSRNDQVALDVRLYLRDEIDNLVDLLKSFVMVIADKAEEYKDAIMPGYTHLQRAQPVTFGFHLMAYANMFLRDIDRLCDCKKRVNVSPIGSCALAGTTYDTDRDYEAELLSFPSVTVNAMDGVSDRDFVVEFISCASLIMMHLSRFSEELVLWSSWEFKFIQLSDMFTTGSSIMPQKKNPDMAELVRGKTGRVYGNLMGILTVLKGLPLAYNKDMQEDKEGLFDTIDTVKLSLEVFIPMIKTLKANRENMLLAGKKGFINATDLADYLVKKGLPFRSAYKIVGETVRKCSEKNMTLEDLSLEEYKAISPLFEEDVYTEISLSTCVNKRISKGGTGTQKVIEQIKTVREKLQ